MGLGAGPMRIVSQRTPVAFLSARRFQPARKEIGKRLKQKVAKATEGDKTNTDK